MISPIQKILENWQYESWDVQTQYKVRNEIMALEIEGLVDVQFLFEDHRNAIRVTPVFATEKDWMWYNLKYDSL